MGNDLSANYLASSRNVRLESQQLPNSLWKKTLLAECRTTGNDWVQASLDLPTIWWSKSPQDLNEFIGNNNGNLAWKNDTEECFITTAIDRAGTKPAAVPPCEQRPFFCTSCGKVLAECAGGQPGQQCLLAENYQCPFCQSRLSRVEHTHPISN